jgi:hypothetical protein
VTLKVTRSNEIADRRRGGFWKDESRNALSRSELKRAQ